MSRLVRVAETGQGRNGTNFCDTTTETVELIVAKVIIMKRSLSLRIKTNTKSLRFKPKFQIRSTVLRDRNDTTEVVSNSRFCITLHLKS